MNEKIDPTHPTEKSFGEVGDATGIVISPTGSIGIQVNLDHDPTSRNKYNPLAGEKNPSKNYE